MKKLLPLLLCISVKSFTVGRTTKSVRTPAAGATTTHKATDQKANAETLLSDANKELAAKIGPEESYTENEPVDMSDAEQEEVAAEANSDEEVASADNHSMADNSDGEGKEISDADGAGDPSGEVIGADDEGSDDFSDDGGDDDSSGDDGD